MGRPSKQQKELERRRAQGRKKQAAYAARKRAEGRTQMHLWVLPEERKIIQKVLKSIPELLEIYEGKSDNTNQSSSDSEPPQDR